MNHCRECKAIIKKKRLSLCKVCFEKTEYFKSKTTIVAEHIEVHKQEENNG
jgi:hypothetical protein